MNSSQGVDRYLKTNTYIDYDMSFNGATSDTYVSSTYERGFATSAHVGIVLCTVGIFFNLILILLLCSSKNLRSNYLYCQILSITIADLGFITLVDSFTVYYELHPWTLGADFCKTWMILDGTLPSVALLALLLLNVDRVLYTYKNEWYQHIMSHSVLHVLLLLTPWCVSCSVVCSLWLGFPAVEPLPNVCMYGITAEAHAASSWLTVFLPSMVILVLLIFVFIAVIGEMPAINQLGSIQLLPTFPTPMNEGANEDDSCDSNIRTRSDVTDRNRIADNGSVTNGVRARRQRRFVTALLAVDFVSLAITLPFSAFSLVSPKCQDLQSCDSLRTLFQTLSWMRSSVTCLRPILFILLTDMFQSCKQNLISWYVREHETTMENSSTMMHGNPSEYLILTRIINKNSCSLRSRNNSTSTTYVMTPPQSPFIVDSPVQTKICTTFSTAVKSDGEITFL
ncbi:5-hydroxytryptamine receptor 2A [Biomphalaria pfeifferi]|uniref:5-hydroxytryptamine receptor 2A n=1 Tax=Biomphalaria pfeifferi TaxID=112525 RepID=A0AAD8FN70_BIOPF|nr:5-hydroxytryptamine receptor 2A [Biomphalaria pfeifferi]